MSMARRGRFKDRTVLVAVGLLGIVAIVFGAGMAAAYYAGAS